MPASPPGGRRAQDHEARSAAKLGRPSGFDGQRHPNPTARQMVDTITRYGQRLFQPPDETIRGIEPDTWYSPRQPVKPMGPPGIEPRAFQYWAGQNLLWTPRADAEYSASDLKELSRYPLARIAIENVKDTICKASWRFSRARSRAKVARPPRSEEWAMTS